MIKTTSKMLAMVALLALAGTSCKNTPKGMTPEEFNKKMAEVKSERFKTLGDKLDAQCQQTSPALVQTMADSIVAARCPVPVKGAKKK